MKYLRLELKLRDWAHRCLLLPPLLQALDWVWVPVLAGVAYPELRLMPQAAKSAGQLPTGRQACMDLPCEVEGWTGTVMYLQIPGKIQLRRLQGGDFNSNPCCSARISLIPILEPEI